jgi:acyl-CoA synthetase (AMP-forming)/AMP-acid ligase II
VERGVSMGTRTEADQETPSACIPHRAITERILELAGQSGYKAALIDAVAGTVTAWPRFAWTIRAAAHGLSRRGLADGDTAAVFVQDAASFATAVNVIRAAGGTALPIQPDTAIQDVAAQLNDGGVRLLITAAPLAEVAVEAADRSWVRQVFTFGEAAGTTSFRSLLSAGKHQADGQMAEVFGPADTAASAAAQDGLPALDALTALDGLAALDALACPGRRAGLSHRDVVIAAPPCGDGQAYTSLLDLALLAGATIVAAPVPLVTAAIRVYRGTVAIVPAGTEVPGMTPDRVFGI